MLMFSYSMKMFIDNTGLLIQPVMAYKLKQQQRINVCLVRAIIQLQISHVFEGHTSTCGTQLDNSYAHLQHCFKLLSREVK